VTEVDKAAFAAVVRPVLSKYIQGPRLSGLYERIAAVG
jgi:hypothetical protein